jgi:hypothetical protein
MVMSPRRQSALSQGADMGLSSADMKAIDALSRATTERTTESLKPFLKQSLWISKTNYFATDIVDRLKSAKPATPEQQRDLAQYIAASTALHANDGWSYLGRAVACLMAGDTHRGLHFAYYAELRAAMSLLGSAGIGIFDHEHYIVPTVSAAAKLQSGKGTHFLAWNVLEYWSQLPDSGALFAKLVRPEGRTLEEWFQPLGGSAALAPQAHAWFMQWGMDLNLAAKDQRARNSSSYRPDGIPQVWNVPAQDALEFVRDMWAALEPSSSSSFDLIDRHILRLALERHWYSLKGKPAAGKDSAFQKFVKDTVTAQGFERSTEDRLTSFLLRKIAAEDPAIFAYSAAKPVNAGIDPFAVLSRAVLLLRTATGSAYDLFAHGGIDSAALSFWWTKIGEARGLWQPGSPPAALSDLWADIEDALQEVAQIKRTQPDALASTRSVMFDAAGRFNIFSSHERVGLWGLCPV